MMKLIISLTLLALSFGLVILAEIPKSDVVVVDQAKLGEVSHANDEFDMRLLQELELENAGKNVFISAFSISSALTMLMAGGVDKTYSEIHDVLGFSKSKFSQNDILYGYQHLMTQLNLQTKDTGNTLNVANAIAIQKNRAILESYLNTITTNFGAQVFAEDFVANSKKSTAELNQWVSEKTHGKIPKLFPDELPASTVMVLMNAIYFKGVWDLKFEKNQTKNEPFHLTREHSESVAFMTQQHKLNYAQFADGELLEMPYKNKTLSMYIFLPNENRNSKQISTMLSTQTFQQRIQMKQSRDVTVHLPKFKFEGSYSMVNTLYKLGMHAAFSNADFSNINGAKDLSVSGVVHKTYIDVNEEGSEAAAATGVIVGTTSVHIPKPPVTFKVDRPFMFFIRNNQHQLTLFSGVINKPEYKN